VGLLFRAEYYCSFLLAAFFFYFRQTPMLKLGAIEQSVEHPE